MVHDLVATVETHADGSVSVLAPGVGRFSAIPEPGTLLGPGAVVGILTRLNQRRRLRLPAGVAGRVAHVEPRHRVVSVGFGQPLFTLEPLSADAAEAVAERARPAGGLWIVAPTDGVFYLRSAPDAAPFVAPGTRVKRGQAVGLVEVMKTFNQVLFDDPGFPEEAEVVEVRVGDATDVGAGDVLIVLRPIA